MIKAMKTDMTTYRAALGLAVATALLLMWVSGAVGIIGSEGHPANVMYFGVLVIGVIGALLTRLKPRGMTRVLFAMALAQMLVPVIALVIWNPKVASWGGAGVVGVFFLNIAFAALFVGSAWLFRKAAQEQSPADAGSQA